MAALLLLGAIVVLALFLALRPLRVDSPATSSARALLRLDTALGATVEPVDRATAGMLGVQSSEHSLVVTSVASNGPAATAGLRVGALSRAVAVQTDAAAALRRLGL